MQKCFLVLLVYRRQNMIFHLVAHFAICEYHKSKNAPTKNLACFFKGKIVSSGNSSCDKQTVI